MKDKDTLGGVLEIVALGLPPGLGSHVHWDRKLEARLGAAVLSVPAIKGVEIGPAFANARLPGTQAQDSIYLEGEALVRRTDRSGGWKAASPQAASGASSYETDSFTLTAQATWSWRGRRPRV
jgi:chorismate synthase